MARGKPIVATGADRVFVPDWTDIYFDGGTSRRCLGRHTGCQPEGRRRSRLSYLDRRDLTTARDLAGRYAGCRWCVSDQLLRAASRSLECRPDGVIGIRRRLHLCLV